MIHQEVLPGKGPVARAGRGGADGDVQRADVFDASVSRARDSICNPAFTGNDYGDPVVCLSQCLAGSSALGIDSDLPADSGAGSPLDRPSDQTAI